MKRIFVYGGSFNPPHWGHVRSVEYILRAFPGSQVFVIPCRFRTGKSGLSDFRHRLAMCRRAFANLNGRHVHVDGSGDMVVVTILTRFHRDYPDAKIRFVVGYDLVKLDDSGRSEMHRLWTHGEYLWKNGSFLVFPRGEITISKMRQVLPATMQIADFLPPPVSGTKIRAHINDVAALSDLVPITVARYIRKYQLFK